jgi:voltage-gated potassium channel
MATTAPLGQQQESHSDRWRVLFGLEEWLRVPMLMLSAAWLAIAVLDLTGNSGPALETVGTVIWLLFIAEFALRFAIAPQKRRFLGRNILTMVALAVPALRLVRAVAMVRAATIVRGVRLVRVIGVVNRSMNALRRTLRRRAFGYVLVLTAAVWLAGSAGMYALEPANEVRGGFTSFFDALWWTGMLLTSIGSQYWPVTTEGRVLGFLLALYSLGILGYLTAILASFFIGRDAHSSEGEVAGAREICELRNEIARLRETLLANDLGSAPVSRSASRRR